MDINSIVVIGRLTQDSASINSSSQGVKFTIANNGIKKDDVTFFNCSWFGDRSIKCMSWLRKGRQVAVNGRMQCRKVGDTYYWGINVSDVQPVGSKSEDTIDDTNASTFPTNPRFRDYDIDERGKRGAELAFEGLRDEEIKATLDKEFSDSNDEFISDLKDTFGGTEDTADVPF